MESIVALWARTSPRMSCAPSEPTVALRRRARGELVLSSTPRPRRHAPVLALVEHLLVVAVQFVDALVVAVCAAAGDARRMATKSSETAPQCARGRHSAHSSLARYWARAAAAGSVARTLRRSRASLRPPRPMTARGRPSGRPRRWAPPPHRPRRPRPRGGAWRPTVMGKERLTIAHTACAHSHCTHSPFQTGSHCPADLNLISQDSSRAEGSIR